ncbi:hypothetical protein QA641_23205 [Bradyrhizobium sp. CB1650]|uniref:hypothetical protein n=1 Tax=Bradyrhizobium sp. CB1650 TaxID=3039153 RepID=UPI00243560D1|nr:hypothetical protein [Bradyrhizobium sp. CB1650]WGD48567.1 hypothetical protein QA641_23205 [Bradyrhizobium sp. CB1650]
MKRHVKLGISIGAMILLVAVVLLQARRVNEFKSGAMRFVPVEAIGFVAVPDLSGFFDHGLPDISEIAKAVASEDFNLARSAIPPPPGLPAQCLALDKASDLASNGIVPHSSFSLAWLDTGFRAAVQLRDDGPGLLFLTDLLFPSYAQLSYQSDTPDADNNATKYRFEFTTQSNDVDVCLKQEWRPKQDAAPVVVESSTSKIVLPMRFRNSVVGATTSPTIELKCTVARNLEPAMPCGCEIIEQGIGNTQTRPARRTNCGQDAFASRKDDLSTWLAELRKGETVMIGNQYVAHVDGFHIIDSLRGGASKRGRYRMSTPNVSIMSDDSLLSRFGEIAASSKRSGATVFAGIRPDPIVGAIASVSDNKISALPMYSLTPIGLHFHENKIDLEVISNMEPQDMAIVQTVAAASKAEAGERGWDNWRKALGGKLSDSSLKLYAGFLRSYFLDIDSDIATRSPLAQVAMDIMEQGAGSIVIAVNQFESSSNVARLAIAVPGIDPEIASSIVSRSRRQSIQRQAKFVIDKATALAKMRGEKPNNLEAAVRDLYCASPLWQLKSLIVKGAETPLAVKVKPVIAIDEQVFLKESPKREWTVVAANVPFRRILFPEDPNVGLWGNAYVNGEGLAQADENEVRPKVDELIEYLEEFRSNLSDNGNDLGPVLDAMGPKLLQQAKFLESRRAFARESNLLAKVEEIMATASVDNTLAKVAGLQGLFKTPSDFLLGPDDIKRFCSTVDGKLPESPLAFYDDKANVLFVADNAQPISALSPPSSKRDADGKLLLGLEAPQLAKLLSGKELVANNAKYFDEFPFARAELVLNGRETGTGVAARLTLSRMDKQ